MKKTYLVCTVMALLLIATSAEAEELRRRAFLGIEFQVADSVESSGLLVQDVVGGTGEKIGIRTGDRLLQINGQPVDDMDALNAIMNASRKGDSLAVVFLRDENHIEYATTFEGRPKETHELSDVIYTSAPYKDGLLRVIVNKPFSEEETLPSLLFIPGYTCTSIDNLQDNHPYKRIVDTFVEAGYVVLRIEKSGMGDNWNTPPCRDEDLYSEVENFEIGLEKLTSLPYVDENRIIIYGHSMGGVVAPAISSRHDVAGVIVYGTTAKSWFEYSLELRRVQNRLAGMDPIAVEESVTDQYEVLYRFFVNKESLADIAKDEKMGTIVRNSWGYDDDGRIYTRNKNYWRQIQDYPHMGNWKNTSAKVLVQFGQSDFQAFSEDDHEQIVWAVNYYHPGHGTLQIFKETDHYFARSGSMQDAYDKLVGGKVLQLFEEYNPVVGRSAVEWSNQVIGR